VVIRDPDFGVYAGEGSGVWIKGFVCLEYFMIIFLIYVGLEYFPFVPCTMYFVY
jgi:hypothetical protein